MLPREPGPKGGAYHATQGEDRRNIPQQPHRNIKTLESKLLVDTPVGDKRYDARATGDEALATHGDVLRPAVAEQIGPDIEGDTSRESGRDLHCHSRGNGKQAALLPRPHLLQAVNGRKGGGHVGGALEIEEAL